MCSVKSLAPLCPMVADEQLEKKRLKLYRCFVSLTESP